MGAGAAAGSLILPSQAPAMGAERQVFAGGRYRFPRHQFQVFAANNNLAVMTETTFVTPGYPTRDHRILLAGYWFQDANHYEVNALNAYPAMVSISIAGGPFLPTTYHGAACVTVNPGANVWSDRGLDASAWTPAYTPITVRKLSWLSDGQWRIGGIGPNTTGASGYVEGARISNDYTTLLPYLAGGALPYNFGGPHGPNSIFPAPSAVVAMGPSGARSILVPGDSIAHDIQDLSFDANNNTGMFVRGLSNAGFGVNDFGFVGAKLLTEGATDGTASFVKRAAALQMLPQMPFDTILSDCGTNDMAVAIDLPTMQARVGAEVARFQSFFPGARIIKSTITPRVTGSFDTQAAQTPRAGYQYPDGIAFQYNAWLQSGGAPIDGAIDLHGVFCATNNPNPGDRLDRWRTENDTAALTGDGLHPNTFGHSIGAPAITSFAQSGAI